MVYPLPEHSMCVQFPFLMVNLNGENTGHCSREDYKYGLAFLHGEARHARKKNYLREYECIFINILLYSHKK